MKRGFLSTISAVALAIWSLVAIGSSPTSADPGLCILGSTATRQIYVDKQVGNVSGASYFDGVRGDATVRWLPVCVGTENQGGTYVLPANVQNDDNGKIFQIGWGRKPADLTRWYYIDGQPTNVSAWNGTVCPVLSGHRYTFKITQLASARASFSIEDQTVHCSISTPGSAKFGNGFDHTWWGYESQNSLNYMGADYGFDGDVNMAYMGYNTDVNGTWNYRTDLVNSYGSGANHMHKTFVSSDPNNLYSGHIGDWVYNNDKFSVNTHD